MLIIYDFNKINKIVYFHMNIKVKSLRFFTTTVFILTLLMFHITCRNRRDLNSIKMHVYIYFDITYVVDSKNMLS